MKSSRKSSPGRVIKKDQRHAGLKESSSRGVGDFGSLIGDLGWGYHLGLSENG